MIPFTPCVHLWEHSSLTADYNYTESNSWTQQHHKQQTANSKQRTEPGSVKEAVSEEEKERTGEEEAWGFRGGAMRGGMQVI